MINAVKFNPLDPRALSYGLIRIMPHPRLFLLTTVIVLACVLLSSCAGISRAKGPPYQNTPITSNGAGRIIVYMPVANRPNTHMYETLVYINNLKKQPIFRGGYHVYEVEPGIHLVSLRNRQPYEESIAVDIKEGDTIYIKYSYHIHQVTQATASSELPETKLEHTEYNPIAPINLEGKALVTKRNYFIDIEHDQTEKSIYETIVGRNDTYLVDPGLHVFDVEVAYRTGAYSVSTGVLEKMITAKSNCIYLFRYKQIVKNERVRVFMDEFCQ